MPPPTVDAESVKPLVGAIREHFQENQDEMSADLLVKSFAEHEMKNLAATLRITQRHWQDSTRFRAPCCFTWAVAVSAQGMIESDREEPEMIALLPETTSCPFSAATAERTKLEKFTDSSQAYLTPTIIPKDDLQLSYVNKAMDDLTNREFMWGVWNCETKFCRALRETLDFLSDHQIWLTGLRMFHLDMQKMD